MNSETQTDTPRAAYYQLSPVSASPNHGGHATAAYVAHSEWNDLPITAKYQTPVKAKLQEAKLQEAKETPVRLKAYMTPDSTAKTPARVEPLKLDPKDGQKEAQKPAKSPIDILWAMMNTLTGKDKMAKVGQYLLRLLIHHANHTRDYLSDEHINIAVIDKRYNDRTKQLNLVRNFIKHPMDFARVVVILFAARFSARFQGMVGGLAMYRQFLRFGKTPFRIRELASRRWDASQLNRKTLGAVIGLYYGINDEALLLFKLGILTNKSVRRVVARHEALAWYYDSILGIYTALENIRACSAQELDLQIQIQVKKKARALSRQILGARGSSPDIASYLNEQPSADAAELARLQYRKKNAYIDLAKWLADFAFDSYTVWRWPLPFASLQMCLGLAAALLSSWKLYRDAAAA